MSVAEFNTHPPSPTTAQLLTPPSPALCARFPHLLLASARQKVAQGAIPKFDSSYERQAVIRGVERCLAEFGLVWSTARLLDACAPPETKQDFLFHLRPILEHAPARDRHEVK